MSDVPTRLLRDALRDHAAAQPSSACMDADTLAAFADHMLPASARVLVETHAADCARCQALLAAMTRTAQAAAAPQPSWWRRPAFGWLVPLAVSAVALLVWVAAPVQKRSVMPAPRDVASTSPPIATAPAAPPAVAVPAESRSNASKPEPRDAGRRALDASSRVPVSEMTTPPAAAPAAVAAAPPPPPAETAAVPQMAVPPAAADSVAGYAAQRAPSLAMKALPPAPAIAAPDGSTAWRLLPDGGVERTTDGGITWQTQQTGAAVTLTAGAAPSATICWLVGPNGTIVRTTDGRSWERVAFPAGIALQSIRASDANNATVTAADGRAFTTRDGGRMWSR